MTKLSWQAHLCQQPGQPLPVEFPTEPGQRCTWKQSAPGSRPLHNVLASYHTFCCCHTIQALVSQTPEFLIARFGFNDALQGNVKLFALLPHAFLIESADFAVSLVNPKAYLWTVAQSQLVFECCCLEGLWKNSYNLNWFKGFDVELCQRTSEHRIAWDWFGGGAPGCSCPGATPGAVGAPGDVKVWDRRSALFFLIEQIDTNCMTKS